MYHYDKIFILGGGLKKDGGKWRTTKYNEGDEFGATGDSIRIIAGSYLFKNNLTDHIIVSCGPGQYRNYPEIPNVASIMRSELIDLGVPSDNIVVENQSDNTYQQIKAAEAIAVQEKLGSLGIISNRYHLPRIQAMIDYVQEINYLRKVGKLISAEKVLLEYAPNKWQEVIDAAYKNMDMRKRIELEEKGVRDIKEGRYKF